MPYRFSHHKALPTNRLEQGPTFPWFSTTYLNMTSAQYLSLAASGNKLGQLWEDPGDWATGGGNAYMLVKFGADTLKGKVLSWQEPTWSTVTAAGSGVYYIQFAAGGLVANAEVGNLLFIFDNVAAGDSVVRVITSNTTDTIYFSNVDYSIASKPYDPNALSAVPTNATPCAIVRPFVTQLATASTVPCGVSLGTGTSGNYGIIQVAGLGAVLSDNSGAATAVGDPLIISAAAGVATGGNGTANAFCANNLVALQAYNAAGDALVLSQINCLGVV